MKQYTIKPDTLIIIIIACILLIVAAFKQNECLNDEKQQVQEETTVNYSKRLQRVVTEDELYYLNMITYMEAGNQPYEGQVAVAAVVLNRLENGNFGDCLWNVLFYPGAFEPCKNNHFVNRNGEIVREVPESLKEQISEAVWAALSGEDPTEGDYYFYNPDACSEEELALRENIGGVTKIGDHVFFSEWN